MKFYFQCLIDDLARLHYLFQSSNLEFFPDILTYPARIVVKTFFHLVLIALPNCSFGILGGEKGIFRQVLV